MKSLREINEALESEIDALETIVERITEAGIQLAKTENTYKVATAKAQLLVRAENSERPKAITVDEVNALALTRCADEHLAFLIAENALTTCRESLRAKQAQVDALRSLGASFRNASG